ncbi:hypothetical protein DPMN_069614 [Dreissena polymorpha]|uniref:Uncharacterized protein n=1 Tax=Dreissena polymorpha TaxID=45954 RepID=A0A9D4BN82_DREPO|nr:hypothetical protein DPMN_069614 [Dreissena polymorpha]
MNGHHKDNGEQLKNLAAADDADELDTQNAKQFGFSSAESAGKEAPMCQNVRDTAEANSGREELHIKSCGILGNIFGWGNDEKDSYDATDNGEDRPCGLYAYAVFTFVGKLFTAFKIVPTVIAQIR